MGTNTVGAHSVRPTFPDKTNMTRFVGDGVLDVPKVTDMQIAIFLLLLLFTSTSVLSQRGAPLGQKGEGNGKLVQNLTFPSPFFPNGSPLWTLPSLNPFSHTLCQILSVLRKTLRVCSHTKQKLQLHGRYRNLRAHGMRPYKTISFIFVHMTINVGDAALGIPQFRTE